MPSSRAILIDLKEFNLDPRVPHTQITASGRLVHSDLNENLLDIEQPQEQKISEPLEDSQVLETSPETKNENQVKQKSNDTTTIHATSEDKKDLKPNSIKKKNVKRNVKNLDEHQTKSSISTNTTNLVED